MGTKFIEALIKKYKGFEYDEVYYFNSILAIMKNAYKARYPHIYIGVNPKDNKSKIEKANFSNETGTVIVEFETFVSWCMDKLVAQKLEQKSYFKSFQNDNQLARYFYKAFENLLIEEIAKLTPGLSSRIKQIDKALKDHCDFDDLQGKKYFRLKKLYTVPVTKEKLFEIAATFQQPEFKYPKKKDAVNNPSIRKNDMQAYLLDIIRQCGGMVFRNDMISLIKERYGYKTLSIVSPSALRKKDGDISENNYFEDFLSVQDSGSNDFCLGQEHYSMALELHDQMDNIMKDVYYYRRVQGFKTQKTAGILVCSVGTVNNLEKAINVCISEYFVTDLGEANHLEQKNQTTPEEINAVLYLLNHLLLEERMN